MPDTYELNRELKDGVVNSLIQSHFREYLQQDSFDYEVVVRTGAQPGRTMAKIRRVSPFWRALVQNPNAKYIIVVDGPTWDHLNARARKALIHHELCHIAMVERENRPVRWRLRDHDITEFEETIRKFGIWNRELARARALLSEASVMEGAEQVEFRSDSR